jgi:hypothetical protein
MLLTISRAEERAAALYIGFEESTEENKVSVRSTCGFLQICSGRNYCFVANSI